MMTNAPLLPIQPFWAKDSEQIDFGTWKLDKNNNTLVSNDRLCEIDLDECKTSAQVLDWIFHYAGRLTLQQKSDMLAAIEKIIDPRRNLCSFGIEQSKWRGPMADVIESIELVKWQLSTFGIDDNQLLLEVTKLALERHDKATAPEQ